MWHQARYEEGRDAKVIDFALASERLEWTVQPQAPGQIIPRQASPKIVILGKEQQTSARGKYPIEVRNLTFGTAGYETV